MQQLPSGSKTIPHSHGLTWRLLRPVLLGMGVIALAVLVLLLVAVEDVGFVANIMFLCVCNVALLIPAFIAYLVLVVANAYMRKLNMATHRQLQKVHGAVTSLEARAVSVSDSVSRRAIDLSEQTAKLDVLFDIFEPKTKGDTDHTHANTNE